MSVPANQAVAPTPRMTFSSIPCLVYSDMFPKVVPTIDEAVAGSCFSTLSASDHAQSNICRTIEFFTCSKGEYMDLSKSFLQSLANLWKPAPGNHSGTSFTTRGLDSDCPWTWPDTLTNRERVHQEGTRNQCAADRGGSSLGHNEVCVLFRLAPDTVHDHKHE